MKNIITDQKISRNIEDLWNVVGRTPVFIITCKYKGEVRKIYAKYEAPNFSGSIKDRMALFILQRAYENNQIKIEDTIIEATSGNTGIALAAIGRAIGQKVIIVMPDWMSKERVDLIKGFGAEIIPVSKEQGGFLGSIKITEEMKMKDDNVFLPCQFSNPNNPYVHEISTGVELYYQMEGIRKLADAFVAGVGTGGTLMGVSKFLKTKNPTLKVYAMEPAESPTITTGYKVGAHRIQGISDEFIPAILNMNEVDEVIQVNDGDAILMAQKLAKELGIGVGISSGANFIAALMANEKLGGGKDIDVATVFSDCNKKYLSTDLMRQEPVKDDYLSPQVELLDFAVRK
jgi:cysteine synthase A